MKNRFLKFLQIKKTKKSTEKYLDKHETIFYFKKLKNMNDYQILKDAQFYQYSGESNQNQRKPSFILAYNWQTSNRKTSISALLTTPKPLTVWITINWKILKKMGMPDRLTCLLRNLYAGQEATVRTGHGTTNLFQIGKGVRQDCILSPCLFNLHAEYIMRNAGLEEAQAGIKIAGRNINNLRYANDTTLMAESEDELKSLLMKVKEESEKVGLKLNIQRNNITASGPITS